MTEYTAEEWARAEFGRHEDGRLAARVYPEDQYPWVTSFEWLADAEMAADPGWRIVRDAESLTAREHLDAAWEKAHVVRRIPAGAGYICKWDDGDIEAEPDGYTYEMLARGAFSERRLLDPPPAPWWHRAQIIRARREEDHESARWARMDSGRWVCLDGESAGIECAPVDLRDVTVPFGADDNQTKGQDR